MTDKCDISKCSRKQCLENEHCMIEYNAHMELVRKQQLVTFGKPKPSVKRKRNQIQSATVHHLTVYLAATGKSILRPMESVTFANS